MRLRIRINVDFPHPDGPISAVTVPGKKSMETSSITCLSPNQAWIFLASMPVPAMWWVSLEAECDAATFAKWGRSIIGNEIAGVFALKGKGLNVRDASVNQLLNKFGIF
jgi:hypothetical protein